MHCGKENAFNFMTMSMVGPNIADLRRASPAQHLTLSTSVRLARQVRRTLSHGKEKHREKLTPHRKCIALLDAKRLQALSAIRDVHKCGFVHRDIKPANFALGLVGA